MNIYVFIMYSPYINNENLKEFGLKTRPRSWKLFGPGHGVVKNVIPAPAIIINPVGYYYSANSG